jgi:hypothetical protein
MLLSYSRIFIEHKGCRFGRMKTRYQLIKDEKADDSGLKGCASPRVFSDLESSSGSAAESDTQPDCTQDLGDHHQHNGRRQRTRQCLNIGANT